jgi:hypothetical protein
VKVPVHPNKDWLLSGQYINTEVPLRGTAIKLKNAIAGVKKKKKKHKKTAKKKQRKSSEKTDVIMWGGRPYDISDVSCFL